MNTWTTKQHSPRLTVLAIALTALVSLALLAQPGAAEAARRLQIVAPPTAPAYHPLPFAAKPEGSTTRVDFYVDGKHRWVDTSASGGWKCGSAGIVRLGTGRHVLKARATQPGRILTTVRSTYVTPDGSSRPLTSTPGNEEGSHGIDDSRPVGSTGPRPAPTARPGDLLWEGAELSDFRENQSADGAIREVPDPAGSGKKVLRFTTNEADIAPITPTSDPRSQVLSPNIVNPGDEMWWHASFYLPNDFPSKVPGWLSIMEGPYGPPFYGSPPFSISADDSEIRFQRNETYQADIPWQEPLVRGRWVDVLVHFRFATDGWVELWIDGQQVTFFDQDRHNPLNEPPTTRLEYKTMDRMNNGGPNFFVLQNYRMRGMFDSATLYHGVTKVGLSRASVEG